MQPTLSDRVRFGSFELDLRAGELRGKGETVVLPEQQFQVLRLLVKRAGEIVTREEIKRKLWPNDTVVEFDHGINNTIKNLRRALSDSADAPHCVETIARRGYRLMMPVEWVEAAPDPSLQSKSLEPAPDMQEFKVGSLTGTIVSHYRTLEIIGGGGMGMVYRAEDLKLGRAVALKFLPEELSNDPQALARFEREARAVSALSHPNICPVYEFDEYVGQPFIVMELLHGKTLRDHLADGAFRLNDPAGLDIAIQATSGLEAAHEQGIIHRDIKPANIFITEKNVAKILDFGVAKVLAYDEPLEVTEEVNRDDVASRSLLTNLTRTGLKLGTAGYMSPEQIRGEALDSRTDIFSFGLVLYEMATGERAFSGETETIQHEAILTYDPRPLRELAPEISPQLVAIISKCLEKDRADRYQSATELTQDLRLSSPSFNQELRHPKVEVRQKKSKRWLWALAAVAVLAIAAAFVLKPAHKRPQINSIAVLPLENLSGDSSQEYFSDGVTEAIITNLGQIKGIRVISHRSVMPYKRGNRSLPEIARDLNVDTLMEGGILRSGNRVRLTAQLVALNPERHIWAASYERDASDIISLQREIAEAVAREIRTALSVAPQATSSKGPVNPQAYELYLRGREHLNYGDETEFRQAIEYLNRAIVLDADYAPAYASLAMAYTQMGLFSVMSRDEASPKAKEAAARALALDDGLAEAHTANAYATFLFDWDWRGPDLEFRRSLELNPNSADAHLLYSIYLTFCGRFDDAIRENQIAIKLDPLNSYVNFNLGWTYFEARRYAEGITFMHELQRRDPNYPFAHHHLAILYAGQGKCTEALAEAEHDQSFDEAFVYATCGQSERALRLLRDAEREVARAKLDPFYPAWMNATLGRRDEAFRWLDRAIQEHSIQLVWVRDAPELDNIRSDPRFAIALRRVGVN